MQNTAKELVEQKAAIMKVLVSDLSTGLTIQKAMEAPKMFQVQKRLGMDGLIKLLCVIIKSFCDSIKVKSTMDTADIFECAELIAETYTHDSVKDVVMALKQAKKKGTNFYNSVSSVVILEIISEYMDAKSGFIEKREADIASQTDGSRRTEQGTIAAQMERYEEKMEKQKANKEFKAIESEKKEIKKIEEFIRKNAKNIE